jgi:hypothetical protein
MRRRDLLTATVGLSLAAAGGSEAVSGLQASDLSQLSFHESPIIRESPHK